MAANDLLSEDDEDKDKTGQDRRETGWKIDRTDTNTNRHTIGYEAGWRKLRPEKNLT